MIVIEEEDDIPEGSNTENMFMNDRARESIFEGEGEFAFSNQSSR